jgi:type I restriction enzyme M protein
MFVPMGLRLNQRLCSARWRWLRDCGTRITSIISLPLDVFTGVEFHNEILIFNVVGLRPHYFLPEEALS